MDELFLPVAFVICQCLAWPGWCTNFSDSVSIMRRLPPSHFAMRLAVCLRQISASPDVTDRILRPPCGFSLPGPPEFWEKFRTPSADSSGLPDPPERVLRAFLLRERVREDSGLTDAMLADPAGRTRVKQAYFRQYPQELVRLRSAEPARP